MKCVTLVVCRKLLEGKEMNEGGGSLVSIRNGKRLSDGTKMEEARSDRQDRLLHSSVKRESVIVITFTNSNRHVFVNIQYAEKRT